ncbi:MAG: hemagglutinin [Bifidobacteriaceae bacterium]|nr:hemagglutinin [Bifidobacteriaceae bacterium]
MPIRSSHRKQRSRKQGFTRQFQRSWNTARPSKRLRIILTILTATVCAIALVISLVRYANWLIEVHEANINQNQLAQTYDFNPGNIISDGQFFNSHAMSESEIQSFLDENGTACTSNECLKTKTFKITAQAKDDICDAIEAGTYTAAQIISKSAIACKVSPKVLLTIMQKEQHLVSATAPTQTQYKWAMGLSCPDDAACDTMYAGFFNQVYGAAKRFHYYLLHEDNYQYHAGTLNYIQYHPNKSCGGTNVYIENDATALLYIYTPYQPNVAALKAGVGTGDSCSSYGNRNFSIIYNSWFGNPRT